MVIVCGVGEMPDVFDASVMVCGVFSAFVERFVSPADTCHQSFPPAANRRRAASKLLKR